jgi:hypothetical protein
VLPHAVFLIFALTLGQAAWADGHHASNAVLQAVGVSAPYERVRDAAWNLDGRVMGSNPLTLSAYIAPGGLAELEVSAPGYESAHLRLRLPEEGELKIPMASQSAGRAWSLASLALGAGLGLAGLVAWQNNAATGASLVGGGLLSISLGQSAAYLQRSAEKARALKAQKALMPSEDPAGQP